VQDPESVDSQRADSAEEAAELWVEQYDVQNADYLVAQGEAMEVEVRSAGEDKWERYRVVAEIVAVYHAHELPGERRSQDE